ncbi:MAG: two pore domain potassium channel family protein [Roseitalea sp.]|jgi:voltage-gated potassium channel|nr:two pore domain potassium channel family protein [Roseitalea sp.]MBO6720847.1 two pore domain potassium channel family protein [Roseitalea sp.]MBO6743152.1 two pore domain potassium channel family protein [Roseitalea sp.]
MPSIRIAALVSSLSLIIAAGTVFFRFVEGWSWVDSYFFAVVTLSTVGYGNLVPATALGKIGTTVFIVLGLGIFAAAIQQIAAATLQRRRIKPPGDNDRTN